MFEELPTVDICLATYNGEKFLQELWESIRSQTHPNWRLLVRDDGSTDSTRDLLDRIAATHSNVHIVRTVPGRLGIVGNFSMLLQCTSAPYVMLADQDDTWHSDKIAQTLTRMVKDEVVAGKKPCLVFSDLRLVDANGRLVAPSFFQNQKLNPDAGLSFRRLLAQNVAPGCTMMANRALVDMALPIPDAAAMHDWWLLLVASGLGSVGLVKTPTIDYRLHGGNQVGAPSVSISMIVRQIRSYRTRVRMAGWQADAFVKRYGPMLSVGDRRAARVLAHLEELPFGLRQIGALRAGLRKHGVLRNVAFFTLM